ncbi:MAG: hypothetical protein NT040_14485 [Bacteroidetes bacterium]|nr:hypothetical protein [Bacteroidota bacterium]
MKTPGKKGSMPFILVLVLWGTCTFAQYATVEETKDFINDRLSHSILQKIDPDGTVTMSAPDQKIKFKLREVSFNYNGGNNDDRVRVFGDNCIEHYEHKSLTEKTSRQSFVCESEKEANEVIAAFKHLKKLFTSDQKSLLPGDKKLKVSDSTFGTKTVGEAIDFINENLSYSMISGIDDKGVMTINAPDDVYLVNLNQADFGYNDASDGSKVRIYGNFCIGVRSGNSHQEFICRKSFQTPGRVNAFKIIPVLYYLKGTYTDTDPSKITGLRNVKGTRTGSYKNVPEAIDFINDRLSYSIILGIDQGGNMMINAPEEVYRFNIHDVKFNNALNHTTRSDWFPFVISDGPSTGVLVECNDCIKKYDAPDSFDKIDEQVFQCRNMTGVKEILKALTYIKGVIKK